MADQAFGLGWGLKALAATGVGAKLSGHAIRAQVEQMARTFIAGSSVSDATPALTHLWTEGKAWSVDLLGEATISDQEADRYRDRCLEALETLAQVARSWERAPLLEQDPLGTVPRVQLSLKISALISSRGSDRSGGQFRHPWRGVSVRSSMRRCGRRPR